MHFSPFSVLESDVSLYWNSTLNSTFDSKCTVNASTPMTASERACAASHLRVWRHISLLRENMFRTSTQRTQTGDSRHSSKSELNLEVNQNINGNKNENLETEADISNTENKIKNNSENRNDSDFLTISKETFRFCRMGGGWVQVIPQATGGVESQNRRNKKKKVSDFGNKIPENIGCTSVSNEMDEKNDWYLIFEDDADVTNNIGSDGFQSILNRLIKQKIPHDFDICYLGHVIPRNCNKRFFRGGDIIEPSYVWCLHAYLLRGKAINILLNNLPINAPVDNFIAQLLYDGTLKVTAKRQLLRVVFFCVTFTILHFTIMQEYLYPSNFIFILFSVRSNMVIFSIRFFSCVHSVFS